MVTTTSSWHRPAHPMCQAVLALALGSVCVQHRSVKSIETAVSVMQRTRTDRDKHVRRSVTRWWWWRSQIRTDAQYDAAGRASTFATLSSYV